VLVLRLCVCPLLASAGLAGCRPLDSAPVARRGAGCSTLRRLLGLHSPFFRWQPVALRQETLRKPLALWYSPAILNRG